MITVHYYVAVEYNVRNESKYYMNGINYRIAVVVKDREEWKFAQFSDAPVDQIVFLNKGFNTNDEKKASKMLKERRNGKVFNRKGDLIEDIGVKVEQFYDRIC